MGRENLPSFYTEENGKYFKKPGGYPVSIPSFWDYSNLTKQL